MGKKRKVKRVVLDTNVILSALLFKGKLSEKIIVSDLFIFLLLPAFAGLTIKKL